MNIKTLLLSSTLALGSIFGGVSEAQARTCFNLPYSAGGGSICNSYVGSNSYGDVYKLGYASGGSNTYMEVTCRGSHVVDWRSNGNMNQQYLNSLARYFCGL